MESMSLFPFCHDLMILSIIFQLLVIALLLLYSLWTAFLDWRQGVVFSATVKPTLEQLLSLPHPNPVLRWAVKWDLSVRMMVEDLKNEGPSAVERYCQNDAFILKLRKILRNVVSQNEMMRITQEVRMKQKAEKFNTSFQNSAQEVIQGPQFFAMDDDDSPRSNQPHDEAYEDFFQGGTVIQGTQFFAMDDDDSPRSNQPHDEGVSILDTLPTLHLGRNSHKAPTVGGGMFQNKDSSVYPPVPP